MDNLTDQEILSIIRKIKQLENVTININIMPAGLGVNRVRGPITQELVNQISEDMARNNEPFNKPTFFTFEVQQQKKYQGYTLQRIGCALRTMPQFHRVISRASDGMRAAWVKRGNYHHV